LQKRSEIFAKMPFFRENREKVGIFYGFLLINRAIGVQTIIFEKANHFLPKSFRLAPK
jgi:hypothetical protein